MPKPPEGRESEGANDPKGDGDLDSWIDNLPEEIESVIPQLEEIVIDVPDTPRPPEVPTNSSEGTPDSPSETKQQGGGKKKAKLAGAGLVTAVAVGALMGFYLLPGDEPVSQPPASSENVFEQPSEKLFEGSSLEETFDPLVDDASAAEEVELGAAAEIFGCQDGYQEDVIDEGDTDTDGNKDGSAVEPGARIDCTITFIGSYGFALVVDGDGEALSKRPGVSYQVRFVVNNEWPSNEYFDETGFDVFVQWNTQAQQYTAVARNQKGERLSNDSDVQIEWLDSSTLQVVVDIDSDVVVTEMRTELVVYAADDQDNYLFDNVDIAIWKSSP